MEEITALRGPSIAGVLGWVGGLGMQCVFVLGGRSGVRGILWGAPVSIGLPPPLQPPLPVSDQPSATSPCCVFLKTNERLTL